MIALTYHAPLKVIVFLLIAVASAHATELQHFQTFLNTDYAFAGVGGMRNIGSGSITLTGVSGTVQKAYLYWNGPTNSSDPTANAAVIVNGTTVVGVNIGFSNDNCWGFLNSQTYRAEVTTLVRTMGNGVYVLSNFVKNSANVNGASLIVLYDDGNGANNHDISIFDGNDSNISNSLDGDGWNLNIIGVNYVSGRAFLQLHVADGQTFPDDSLIVNGQTVAAAGPIFQGDSVPSANSGPSGNGSLWDIKSFEITSLLSPGQNSLHLTSGVLSDCLGLNVAIVDIQRSAPQAVPVIVIPGTLGSEIGYGPENDFTRLWPDAFHLFDSVEDIRKTKDGNDVKQNVRSRNILDSVLTKDIYGGFLHYLETQNYQRGVNLFGFPFDWRDSIRNTASMRSTFGGVAGNLKDQIANVLCRTGSSQVDVVAHSLGGLVALQYVQNCVENGNCAKDSDFNSCDIGPGHHIRNLITVGTPFLGTPDSYQAIRYGREVLPYVGTSASKRISHNLPAIYQQLPSQAYFSAGSAYGDPAYIRDTLDIDANSVRGLLNYNDSRQFLTNAEEEINTIATCGLFTCTPSTEDYVDPSHPTANPTLIADAEILHNALDDFGMHIPADMSLYAIAGWNQQTKRVFEEKQALNEPVLYVDAKADLAGDATVPLWSAAAPNAKAKYFINLAGRKVHYQLMGDNCVQQIVGNILKGQSLTAACSNLITNSAPSASVVSARQWTVQVFSPVDLHLTDNAGNHTGKLADGTFEEGVAQSSFERKEDYGAQGLSFVLQDGLTLNLVGTGNGSFSMRVREDVGTNTERTLLYRNIPITTNSKGYIVPEFGDPSPLLHLDLDGNGTIDMEISPIQIFLGDDPLEVLVQVKPGSSSKSINLASQGLIPIAILSTNLFDARDIDPLSVRFGRGQAIEAHLRGHLEDVNGDGRVDMVLHFRTQESGIETTDRAVCLIGNKRDHTTFQGCDGITIVR
jgi:pimeloyl-ACP methyl ester carboxylesterase